METTFEYCSFQYLNFWESNDKEFHISLNGDKQEEEKLKVIKKAATVYKVARNLPKKFDDSRRYGYLLDILEDINETDFKIEPIKKILYIESQISKKYGNRSVLSLTTKFLWLKFRQPIIIYDSQARIALGTNVGDLQGFYEKWQDNFNKVEDDIKKVCYNLKDMYLYLPNQRKGLKEDIEKISTQTWFHERVFDTYLWNKGTI